MSFFRTAPVTSECLIVCIALFAICQARTLEDIRYLDAQRAWGAAVTLQIVPIREGSIELIHRQLQGPFDLWDGEWWRIGANAFHHVNILHLLTNFASAWILGRRLERRWGSVRYAIFLVPAAFIPLLADFLMGNTPMGFSGAICAMMGALMVLQKIDPRDFDIPDEVILTSLCLIVLGIPATAFNLIKIANASHVCGVVYGWLVAQVFCAVTTRKNLIRVAFVAAHLLVIPVIWVVTHPIHNGRYLWYLAMQNPRMAPQEREMLLKQACQTDPSLTGIWMRLAHERVIEDDLHGAWVVLINGLSHNPSDQDLIEAVRSIWRRLPTGPSRDAAEDELRRVFGNRAAVWSQQIRGVRQASRDTAKDKSSKPLEPELDPKNFPLDRPVDLEWQPHPVDRLAPPQFDPNRPDSASEGSVM